MNGSVTALCSLVRWFSHSGHFPPQSACEVFSLNVAASSDEALKAMSTLWTPDMYRVQASQGQDIAGQDLQDGELSPTLNFIRIFWFWIALSTSICPFTIPTFRFCKKKKKKKNVHWCWVKSKNKSMAKQELMEIFIQIILQLNMMTVSFFKGFKSKQVCQTMMEPGFLPSWGLTGECLKLAHFLFFFLHGQVTLLCGVCFHTQILFKNKFQGFSTLRSYSRHCVF